MNKCISIMFAILLLVSTVQIASAVSVTSVNSQSLTPGQQGTLRIEIENTLDDDVEDLSISLRLTGLPFVSVGSTEDSVDNLDSDDDEEFAFTIRPSYDIRPGDYQIPYEIRYTVEGQNTQQVRNGSIGVHVTAEPQLQFSVDAETPVVGQQGKITLRIVNNGLADARFVSVEVQPRGYTLLSDDQVYIGTVSSDDFETATFDVVFNEQNARFNAIVRYKNLNNQDLQGDVILPVNVYTRERALELGIIEQSRAGLYIGIIALVIVIWFVWRAIAKRRRMKRSLHAQ